MKTHVYLVMALCAIMLSGCATVDYRSSAGSASVFLSHHSVLFTLLGPSGRGRSSDDYIIYTKSMQGKIDAASLNVFNPTTMIADARYSGYIEFLGRHRLNVQLYREQNGSKTPLSINGKQWIRIVRRK